MRRYTWHVTLGLLGLVLLALLVGSGAATPTASAHAIHRTHASHALPVRSEPARDAILQAPPAQVRIWFSEDLNASSSRIIVVDPANREVDRKDSHVSESDARQLTVSLPLLPAGTYIVTWRSQSADDGHISSGSYIFRIARPDGSVPAVPAVLPTGTSPGAGGASGPSGTLDAPTILQSAATWLALLLLTLWVGGLAWQTWILPPQGALASRHSALAAAAHAAALRFRRFAPLLLGGILLSDVGIVLGQSAALAGDWSGAFSLPLLRAVLFGSRFGAFWWLRQGVTLAALTLTLVAARAGRSSYREVGQATADIVAEGAAIPAHGVADWRREVLLVLRDVPRLPVRMLHGVRALTTLGRAELGLGAALLVAFALSGHAAAVPASTFGYAILVDLLHLAAEAAWIGGLFYIGAILLPTLVTLTPRQRAEVMALGLPAFGALAIVSALLLALTGSLNTTIRLTSISQFLTTAYGRTLAVKIEVFLLIAAISAYHAFFLRPRLARMLADESSMLQRSRLVAAPAAAVASATVSGTRSDGRDTGDVHAAAVSLTSTGGAQSSASEPLAKRAQDLAERLEDWLRREAVLGVVVLLCVALLGAFSGTLSPVAATSSAPTTASAYISAPQAVQGYHIILKVTPDTFGTNTFTVTVRDASGAPLTGAAVQIETQILDMDMGTQMLQLQPIGASAPGSYSGQSDLTMAGHWSVVVKVLPPGSKEFVQTEFRFSAAYPAP